MAKKLLIDATHPEEIRVAVVKGQILEDFDSETSTKKQLKGNIYLAKVIRVEPSLQAAFVEFGGNRHGFLPFSEIHPDYYRLPVSDRASVKEESFENGLIEEVELLFQEEELKNQEDLLIDSEELNNNEIADEIEQKDDEASLESDEEKYKTNKLSGGAKTFHYKYKIQEVIKRRHILLVQVAKEERGNKGASLTTYLSLPGRYCVLMPNAGYRAGGVSRKINDGEDRRRLKDLVKDLSTPEGMALIVRTAGQERNKTEIRRDYEYLLRLWNEIRELTMKSIAPCLVYAEGDLIKKAIRDIYDRDVEEILVEGEEAYKQAKNFMRQLIPSHARKVKLFRDENYPLFQCFKVEEQIGQMMYPSVRLPSGGSIVINITEALVAVDVNSGRSTRERHIDETALKTNLEAADELARQMRLRDLAGLVVVDFIDMSENSHIQQVEKRLREAVKADRARIQLGKISQFGLMEMSRQRLRPSLLETYTITCNHCHGTGLLRSVESMALHVLRDVETNAIQHPIKEVLVTVPNGVDLYLLNQKRQNLIVLEKRFNLSIQVNRDLSLSSPDFRLDILALHEKSNVILPLKDNPPISSSLTHAIIANDPLPAKDQLLSEQPSVKQEKVVQAVTEQRGEDKTGQPRNRRRIRRRRSSHVRNDVAQEIEKELKSESTEQQATVPEGQNSIEKEVKKPDNSGNVFPLKKKNRRYPRQIKSRNSSTEVNSLTERTSSENFRNDLAAQKAKRGTTNYDVAQEQVMESVQENTKVSPVSKKRSKGWLRRLLDS
jgi:ribonuclease E